MDRSKDVNGAAGAPFVDQKHEKTLADSSTGSMVDMFAADEKRSPGTTPRTVPGSGSATASATPTHVSPADTSSSAGSTPTNQVYEDGPDVAGGGARATGDIAAAAGDEEQSSAWYNPLTAVARGLAGLTSLVRGATSAVAGWLKPGAVVHRIPGDSTDLLQELKKPYSSADSEALHAQISVDLKRQMRIDINGIVLPAADFDPEKYGDLMTELGVSAEDANNCKYFLQQGSAAKALELVMKQFSESDQLLLAPKAPLSVKVGVDPQNHTLSLDIEFEPRPVDRSDPSVSLGTLKVVMKVPDIRKSNEWTLEYERG